MHGFICNTSGNGFRYHYERNKHSRYGTLKPGEEAIVIMPQISANKRGINDIGWQTDGAGVVLYGTFSPNPESDDAMWSKINNGAAVNKTVTALKFINNGSVECNVSAKVILF
ncbi:MAG: hypothetical protein J1G06_09280 [Oscillospiraceae bacterium]|nr:hypothetical protein [Oscillospiraceae bacterium]